jgi:hypothetical protein
MGRQTESPQPPLSRGALYTGTREWLENRKRYEPYDFSAQDSSQMNHSAARSQAQSPLVDQHDLAEMG